MFNPVRVVRASEDVVEQIKEAVFSGRLSPGDRLPAEREMVREFGLSRITIREAIRTLEAAGIVRVRTGSNGGAFVADVSQKIVSDSLTTLLKLQKATLHEMSEVRQIIEPVIVEMAAQRADNEDLAALEQAVGHTRRAIANGTSHAGASLEFHTALAKAAKNRALLSVVISFQASLYDALDRLGVIPEMPLLALEYHHKIYEAIKRHDGARARRLMEIHLQHFEERLHKVIETEVTGVKDSNDNHSSIR